jgi:methylenetetrahydrofolate reductase (NADPH)
LKIVDIIQSRQLTFSFEFFPPKTDEEMVKLFVTLGEVKKLGPGYISVTYTPGGATKDKTMEIVRRAKNEIDLEAMAHLTCAGQSREEIRAILDELERSGIENVIALRGDPMKGEKAFTPHPDGFRYASELTQFIRSSYGFCVAVAGYPEGHIESPDRETDWNNLKRKVEAGAHFMITQLFFDNRDFFHFETRMREKGVTVPIIPGIMPITNYNQIMRFTEICGAKIPREVQKDLLGIRSDLDAVQDYGIAYATRQCKELIAHGVPGIHFYTLNKSKSSQKIVGNLRA